MLWAWAISLLILGLGLALMEVFFPSAGILGFLSLGAMLASIIVGFQHSTLTGFLILGVAAFGLPTLLVLAFRYWPRTAMGRRVMLSAPSSKDVLPQDSQREYLKSLVGRTGRAKCKMLPGGAITIDGRTVDAMSEGMPIEPGQPVRVIQVRANRVVVRLEEDEAPSMSAEDPLQRPIESIVPDPFRDGKD